MSKNDNGNLLLKEIRDLLAKQNTKLDQLLNLGTVLTDTLNEDFYLRSRAAAPEVYQFDPKEYD